ncbi:MAG: NADH-quinone oxidoreductase subunit K [Bacteroidales bacterium]|nr:NADH-quinone oxidoreductase subunit K [Bacteroidales bacterium]MBN2634023.1 NADH-quinone oxidoreductase subunit K [Bacteroidales bacterium]
MNTDIHLEYYLITAVVMFSAGIYGLIIRKSRISVTVSLALMLNSVIINFAAFNSYLFFHKTEGLMVALMLIAVMICEAAVAIVLFMKIRTKEEQAKEEKKPGTKKL